jgi:hypothetical protein
MHADTLRLPRTLCRSSANLHHKGGARQQPGSRVELGESLLHLQLVEVVLLVHAVV